MKIAIISPIFRNEVHGDFAMSLARIVATYGLENVVWQRGHCAEISHGRNAFLKQFRESDAGVACWIDGDVGYSVEDFRAIVDPVIAGALDVASGAYPYRRPGPPIPTGLDFLEEDLDVARGYVGPVRELGGRRFWRARRVAGGFTAWSRDAIEKACVIAPHPRKTSLGNVGAQGFVWLYGAGVYDGEAISEDHRAADIARAAGVEIWCAVDAMPRHMLSAQTYVGQPGWLHAHAINQAKAYAANLGR